MSCCQKTIYTDDSEGQKIPFDTSHVRTIYYALDVKSAEETKDRLEKLIQRNLDGETENPISIGLDALKLKGSQKPEQQITAEIFKLQTLDNRLGIIQNQIVRQASRSPFDPNYGLFAYDELSGLLPIRTSETLRNNIVHSLLKLSEEEKEHLYKELLELVEDTLQKDKDTTNKKKNN